MRSDDVFRVNGPGVIWENIDGEVVLIHLETGTYYSTDGTGAEAWDLLAAGYRVGDVLEVLRRRYVVEAGQVEAAFSRFLSELQAEALILLVDETAQGGERQRMESAAGAERLPFRPPVLSKHNDMKDLLLLDPIHDVEETGWPVPKPTRDPR